VSSGTRTARRPAFACAYLVLTQWYPPEPPLLMQELAQTLQSRGHEVTVLTGFPNYPSGRIYPGYRLSLWQKETVESVPVVRVALYPDHGSSAVKRVGNYVSFALSCAVLAPFLVPRPDVLFVYHPPLTVGIPAIWLGWLWGVPFVYQIQDMWPETLRATAMVTSRRVLAWVGRFARWVYARASALVVISPGFRQNLLARTLRRRRSTSFRTGWTRPSITPVERDAALGDQLKLTGRFNVMFAGNMGEAQGLETVLEAAARLRELSDVQFVLVGDGIAVPRLQALARERQLAKRALPGPVSSPTDARPLRPGRRAPDSPEGRSAVSHHDSHKTFAYMASGKPVLAAMAGDAAGLIANARAGLVCPPEDSEAMQRRSAGCAACRRQTGAAWRRTVSTRFDTHTAGRNSSVASKPCWRTRRRRRAVQGGSSRRQRRGFMYRRGIKRVVDVVLSSLALLVLWPLLLALSLVVWAGLGAPVLFRQVRPGLRGRPFTILKFRSMTDARDADGALLPDADRLPRFGRWLRSTSLDELPELLNVWKGDMSLVGPRPC